MAPHDQIAQIERETIAAIDGVLGLIEKQAGGLANRRARFERALRDIRRSIARPAVFALAGEFNSGKSTLSNRLAGIDALPTDLFANTSVPTRLHWADEPEMTCLTGDGRRLDLLPAVAVIDEPLARIDVGVPAPLLRDIELIDLPGLADPDAARDEAEIVASRADGVIWCTPVTQAWKETENAVWSRLPVRLKRRTVVALTFCDLIVDDDRLFGLRRRHATGAHQVDLLCAELGIDHRLAPPMRPQTNGMVERFNGRIEDVLQSHRFRSGEDLEQTILRYVQLYNSQLPQTVLKGRTPIGALKDWHRQKPELFKKRPYNHPGCDR
jgi:energy-coupling factor transporter ATP-binding protein EcfA2